MPKITKVIRDDSKVAIHYVTDGIAAEIHKAEFPECPAPKFDKCFQALGPIAANILETDYTKGMIVQSLTIHRTKHGTKSAVIGFTKVLDAVDHPHTMDTPQFRIDEPAAGEQGIRQCAEKQSKQIYAMIEQAEKYLAGERSQTLLPLKTVKAGDEQQPEGESLPFEKEGQK